MTENPIVKNINDVKFLKGTVVKKSDSFNPFLFVRQPLGVQEGPFIKTTLDYGNHFVLDHPINGELDSAVFELDTGLGTRTDFSEVFNRQDFFRWFFDIPTGTLQKDGKYGTLGFTDEANSTATEDTVTNHRVDFTSGQVWQSNPIFKTSDTGVTYLGITLAVESTGVLDWEVTANGGSNWESITPGTTYYFTNTGRDVRLRATEDNSSTAALTFISARILK